MALGFARNYGPGTCPEALVDACRDAGIFLADAEQNRATACAFCARPLIWIEIPSRIAAERIAGRTGGNSRFDGRPRIETTARLDKLLDLYNLIMGLFKQHMD